MWNYILMNDCYGDNVYHIETVVHQDEMNVVLDDHFTLHNKWVIAKDIYSLTTAGLAKVRAAAHKMAAQRIAV